jgi:hypothetical protein
MAKGKKTGGRNFVKGQVTNPNGRPPMPKEFLEIKDTKIDEFRSIIFKYMDMSPFQIKELMDKNEVIINGEKLSHLPAKELIVLKFVYKAMQDADINRLNLLLDRTIGKVVEKVDVRAAVVSKPLHEQIVDEIEKHEVIDIKP